MESAPVNGSISLPHDDVNDVNPAPSSETTAVAPAPPAPGGVFLNVGCGPRTGRPPHPVFSRERWSEVRLDIDVRVQPDVVGSITDVGTLFKPASFDAVWSSHSIEHLHTHQVAASLKGIRSVLRSDGFVVIRCPDMETAMALLLEHGSDFVVYESAVGPITPLDMLFGHSRSIANGYQHMAHNTGFTSESLGQALVDADFSTVITKREAFDLWALGLCCDTARSRVQLALADAGLYMFDADCAPFIAGDTQPAGAP